MTTRKTLIAIACLAVATFAAPAFAQTSSTVEFTSVTRLPGITLQPGKYVFKLVPSGDQKMVEVYSSDGSRKIVALPTVDYTAARTGTSATVTFERTNPTVLRVYYFPGDTVGREFVFTDEEARTIYAASQTPVRTAARTIGETARAITDAAKDVARGVADVAQDLWDDVEDNARLVNPTATRKAAERHLDNAERAYSQLMERLDDAKEAPLKGVGAHLEALEDAFEKNDASWMTHYSPLLAELDRLAPEGAVGTSGSATLDASTTAGLISIRAHLKAFHAQAMK